MNIDQKSLVDWVNEKKLSLNVKETKMAICKPKRKKIDGKIKLKLSRLFPIGSLNTWELKLMKALHGNLLQVICQLN